MRLIVLAAALVMLAACGGHIAWGHYHGLDPPPKDAHIPEPHG
jgi:hypothetical protein